MWGLQMPYLVSVQISQYVATVLRSLWFEVIAIFLFQWKWSCIHLFFWFSFSLWASQEERVEKEDSASSNGQPGPATYGELLQVTSFTECPQKAVLEWGPQIWASSCLSCACQPASPSSWQLFQLYRCPQASSFFSEGDLNFYFKGK